MKCLGKEKTSPNQQKSKKIKNKNKRTHKNFLKNQTYRNDNNTKATNNINTNTQPILNAPHNLLLTIKYKLFYLKYTNARLAIPFQLSFRFYHFQFY